MTTYCIKCGNKVQDDAAFCQSCGSQTAISKPTKRDSSYTTVCPLCQKDDMCRKVSSIALTGTANFDARGHSLGFAGDDIAVLGTMTSGESQTALSKRLAAPTKPAYSTSVIFLWLFPLLFGPFMIFVMSIEDAETVTSQCYAPFIIITILGVVGFFLYRRSKKQFDDQRLPLWEKSISKWKELYYCGRDDIVFDPSSRRYVDSENMYLLLPYNE